MIIQFISSLYICVVVHELGHLIVAKLCGCGVPTYAVGFGKILLHKKIGKTDYQLRLLPFGGFCELEGELKPSKRKGSFTNLPYMKKFYISVAGCAVNIILGTVVGLIGYYNCNYNARYFGFLSIALGLTNLIPIIPCLDGGYLLYFPLCIKIWGKRKGILIFQKIVKVSFKIVMWLNYLCIPWLIMNWRRL